VSHGNTGRASTCTVGREEAAAASNRTRSRAFHAATNPAPPDHNSSIVRFSPFAHESLHTQKSSALQFARSLSGSAGTGGDMRPQSLLLWFLVALCAAQNLGGEQHPWPTVHLRTRAIFTRQELHR
jgi:hypothetical protein